MKKAKTIILTVWLTVSTLGTVLAGIEAWFGMQMYTEMMDAKRAVRRYSEEGK